MNALSRRELLARIAGAGMVVAGGLLLRRIWFPRGPGAAETATFEAFLDTLLPGRGLPSWRATGVQPRLLDELSRERRGRRLLSEGVSWLDTASRRRAGVPFARLDAAGRSAVVGAAAASASGTWPRTFYRVVRDRAMRLHHAHPAVWRALGVRNAPQPDGYLDFEDAPRA